MLGSSPAWPRALPIWWPVLTATESSHWQATEPGAIRQEIRAFSLIPPIAGRGWATATTSALVERALNEGKVVLYQTLETNTAAIKIARQLGYEQYARHVAVRLKAGKPSNPAFQRPGIARC